MDGRLINVNAQTQKNVYNSFCIYIFHLLKEFIIIILKYKNFYNGHDVMTVMWDDYCIEIPSWSIAFVN